jgi:PKD repeat protein
VAAAGPDQTADEGAPVRFDGSGSSDADGDPLSYSWDFGDGGTGTGVNPTHTYADNGTFTVTLTVSDGHGGSSTDTAVVAVRNVAPVAGVGGPATGVRGQARTFTLTADDVSAADRAAPFGYRIDWGDGTTGTASGPAAGTPVAHAYTAAGTYTVRVWATDKDGAEGAVASWSHTTKVVEVQGTDLVIGGTTGNDTILVTATPTANTVTVAINGASQGTFTAAGQLVVYAQAGDDKVSFATRKVSGTTYFTSQPLLLFGEAGNDTLDARNAIGAAVLVGGAGNDVLWGSRGRTNLIGGAGADDARGGDAEDVVIGGATSYDADPTGLAALRAEWARTDAGYATRRDRLLGVQGGGFNGAYVLSAAGPSPTVQDDGGQADTLFGYGGQDWYFAAATDRLGDRQSNETVTGL